LPSKKATINRLIAGNLFLFFGFNVWRSLFNNFAIEELAVRADQIGLIQSIRELPGLLGFWLAFLALILSELQVLSLSTVVMGLGLIALAWADSWASLIVGTLIMSIGFHAFYPYSSAVALKATEGRETTRLLGTIRSAGAVAAVAATLSVLLMIKFWDYRTIFIVAGGITAIGGLAIFRRERGGEGRHRERIVVRRRYWLYYVLTFLMGSRRHIFSTFAIFLLVQKFNLPAQQTALLLLVNNVLGIVVFRYMGDLVGRVGERWTLTGNFALLFVIFLGYAFLDSLIILSIFFVVDNLLFGFNLALESYFQRIAVCPEEVVCNMNVGQTINHIAAIFVPIAGGLMWETYGSEATFIAGAAIVLVSLALTQLLDRDMTAATELVGS